MIKTNIRDATIEDARYIGHRLRQADLIEIEAYGDNVNPAILTIESFRYSKWQGLHYRHKPQSQLNQPGVNDGQCSAHRQWLHRVYWF